MPHLSKDNVTSLTPHMHLRGKAMRYVAHYPDGRSETLLYVPGYDFNWQFTYLSRQADPDSQRHSCGGHCGIQRLPQITRRTRIPKAPFVGVPPRKRNNGWLDKEFVDADQPGDSNVQTARNLYSLNTDRRF